MHFLVFNLRTDEQRSGETWTLLIVTWHSYRMAYFLFGKNDPHPDGPDGSGPWLPTGQGQCSNSLPLALFLDRAITKQAMKTRLGRYIPVLTQNDVRRLACIRSQVFCKQRPLTTAAFRENTKKTVDGWANSIGLLWWWRGEIFAFTHWPLNMTLLLFESLLFIFPNELFGLLFQVENKIP